MSPYDPTSDGLCRLLACMLQEFLSTIVCFLLGIGCPSHNQTPSIATKVAQGASSLLTVFRLGVFILTSLLFSAVSPTLGWLIMSAFWFAEVGIAGLVGAAAEEKGERAVRIFLTEMWMAFYLLAYPDLCVSAISTAAGLFTQMLIRLFSYALSDDFPWPEFFCRCYMAADPESLSDRYWRELMPSTDSDHGTKKPEHDFFDALNLGMATRYRMREILKGRKKHGSKKIFFDDNFFNTFRQTPSRAVRPASVLDNSAQGTQTEPLDNIERSGKVSENDPRSVIQLSREKEEEKQAAGARPIFQEPRDGDVSKGEDECPAATHEQMIEEPVDSREFESEGILEPTMTAQELDDGPQGLESDGGRGLQLAGEEHDSLCETGWEAVNVADAIEGSREPEGQGDQGLIMDASPSGSRGSFGRIPVTAPVDKEPESPQGQEGDVDTVHSFAAQEPVLGDGGMSSILVAKEPEVYEQEGESNQVCAEESDLLGSMCEGTTQDLFAAVDTLDRREPVHHGKTEAEPLMTTRDLISAASTDTLMYDEEPANARTSAGEVSTLDCVLTAGPLAGQWFANLDAASTLPEIPFGVDGPGAAPIHHVADLVPVGTDGPSYHETLPSGMDVPMFESSSEQESAGEPFIQHDLMSLTGTVEDDCGSMMELDVADDPEDLSGDSGEAMEVDVDDAPDSLESRADVHEHDLMLAIEKKRIKEDVDALALQFGEMFLGDEAMEGIEHMDAVSGGCQEALVLEDLGGIDETTFHISTMTIGALPLEDVEMDDVHFQQDVALDFDTSAQGSAAAGAPVPSFGELMSEAIIFDDIPTWSPCPVVSQPAAHAPEPSETLFPFPDGCEYSLDELLAASEEWDKDEGAAEPGPECPAAPTSVVEQGAPAPIQETMVQSVGTERTEVAQQTQEERDRELEQALWEAFDALSDKDEPAAEPVPTSAAPLPAVPVFSGFSVSTSGTNAHDNGQGPSFDTNFGLDLGSGGEENPQEEVNQSDISSRPKLVPRSRRRGVNNAARQPTQDGPAPTEAASARGDAGSIPIDPQLQAEPPSDQIADVAASSRTRVSQGVRPPLSEVATGGVPQQPAGQTEDFVAPTDVGGLLVPGGNDIRPAAASNPPSPTIPISQQDPPQDQQAAEEKEREKQAKLQRQAQALQRRNKTKPSLFHTPKRNTAPSTAYGTRAAGSAERDRQFRTSQNQTLRGLNAMGQQDGGENSGGSDGTESGSKLAIIPVSALQGRLPVEGGKEEEDEE
ncbi:hypothetical protein HIM_03050 [Hirsutella minnesotensis 3608]|nr:hypothetical protein HIM_03050 [Hirsutella minnesotensis 3608]